MLTAYFDASGSVEGTEILSVAGFVSTSEKWTAFEKVWKRYLYTFGVSSLHMKHLAHSRGEYEGWSVAKRKLFLSEMVYTIEDHYEHSVANSVIRQAFKATNEEFLLAESTSQFGYAACKCIHKIKEWADAKGHDFSQIVFIFEDGDVGKGKMLELAKVAFNTNPILWKKEKSVVLQAADLLAYENFQLCKRVLNTAPEELADQPLRDAMQYMWQFKGSDKWSYTDVHNLRQGCELAHIPLRESALLNDRESIAIRQRTNC